MADVTPIAHFSQYGAPGRRASAPEPRRVEPLWREVLGERLRELRADREETLADTARRAGISPQYLSEIERGIKEPSSEMISAVAGALDTSLAEIASDIGRDLGRRAAAPARVTFALAA